MKPWAEAQANEEEEALPPCEANKFTPVPTTRYVPMAARAEWVRSLGG